MTTVKDVLEWKPTVVHCVSRTASVYEALESMVRHDVGALVVTDQGRACGLLTERDYLRRVALEGRTSRETRVDEIMTRDFVVVIESTAVETCMRLMTEHRTRHLVVLLDSELVGIVSIGDVLKHLLSTQEAEIVSLTHYIQGYA